jgi:hypothetical protein
MNRNIRELFDVVVKKLMRLSAPAMVRFINGMFGTGYPLDSAVAYPDTTMIAHDYAEQRVDVLIAINESRYYHIEAMIANDDLMIVRVFEYGYEQALQHSTQEGDVVTLDFPSVRVLYLEPTPSTPDFEVLRLRFQDGSTHDFRVDSFKLLEHTVEELEAQGLEILLPLYLLKFRARVRSAARRGKLRERMPEFTEGIKGLFDKIVAIVQRREQDGSLSVADAKAVLEAMDIMYQELYQKEYEEFEEAKPMIESEWVKAFDAKMAEKDKQNSELQQEVAALKAQIAKLREGKPDADVA